MAADAKPQIEKWKRIIKNICEKEQHISKSFELAFILCAKHPDILSKITDVGQKTYSVYELSHEWMQHFQSKSKFVHDDLLSIVELGITYKEEEVLSKGFQQITEVAKELFTKSEELGCRFKDMHQKLSATLKSLYSEKGDAEHLHRLLKYEELRLQAFNNKSQKYDEEIDSILRSLSTVNATNETAFSKIIGAALGFGIFSAPCLIAATAIASAAAPLVAVGGIVGLTVTQVACTVGAVTKENLSANNEQERKILQYELVKKELAELQVRIKETNEQKRKHAEEIARLQSNSVMESILKEMDEVVNNIAEISHHWKQISIVVDEFLSKKKTWDILRSAEKLRNELLKKVTSSCEMWQSLEETCGDYVELCNPHEMFKFMSSVRLLAMTDEERKQRIHELETDVKNV